MVSELWRRLTYLFQKDRLARDLDDEMRLHLDLRARKLGLRMALGAAPRSIVALVLKQTGVLTAAGVAIGLGGAFGLTRYVQGLLFGIERTDWKTYAAAVALLVVVGVAVALIPAGRIEGGSDCGVEIRVGELV